jgi:hypothetical protein
MESCQTSILRPEFTPSTHYMPLSAPYLATTVLDFPWASNPNQTDCFFSFSREVNFETVRYDRQIGVTTAIF